MSTVCDCTAVPVMRSSAFIARTSNLPSPGSRIITMKRRRSGYADKAVVFALRAAESAVRLYAYEDALLHYDHVIKTLESSGLMHDERLARAYILKGSALNQLGQVQQSMEVLLEAVNRTRVLGSAELLVDVLMLLAMIHGMLQQQHILPLLERTLRLLPEADSAARAKALATLAFAQRTLTDKSRTQLLVDEALDMASRSCDAAARCACYHLTVMALRGNPETCSGVCCSGEDNCGCPVYGQRRVAGGSLSLAGPELLRIRPTR